MEGECPIPQKKARSKPKVIKEWDDDDVYKLIHLVEMQICLWNAGDDGYHNKMLKRPPGEPSATILMASMAQPMSTPNGQTCAFSIGVMLAEPK